MRPYDLIAFALTLLVATTASAGPQKAETVPTYVGQFDKHVIGFEDRLVVEKRTVLPNGEGLGVLSLWDPATGFRELARGSYFLTGSLDAAESSSAIAVISHDDLALSGAQTEEVYRWRSTTGWQRITITNGSADRLFPHVRISEDGRRIAFASRDDYTGENDDGELQIFLWEEGEGFRQITHAESCGPGGGNFLEDLSGDGRRIAFQSRCQIGSANPDLQDDYFLWDESDGIRPLTHGTTPVSASVALDRQGRTAAFNVNHSGNGIPGIPGANGRRLLRWVDGRGFEQLSKHAISKDFLGISGDGSRIVFSAPQRAGRTAQSRGQRRGLSLAGRPGDHRAHRQRPDRPQLRQLPAAPERRRHTGPHGRPARVRGSRGQPLRSLRPRHPRSRAGPRQPTGQRQLRRRPRRLDRRSGLDIRRRGRPRPQLVRLGARPRHPHPRSRPDAVRFGDSGDEPHPVGPAPAESPIRTAGSRYRSACMTPRAAPAGISPATARSAATATTVPSSATSGASSRRGAHAAPGCGCSPPTEASARPSKPGWTTSPCGPTTRRRCFPDRSLRSPARDRGAQTFPGTSVPGTPRPPEP